MKRIFDDVANPLIQSTLEGKALEQKILMASKGADGDDSVAGGHKAKGVAQTGAGSNSSKKKSAQNYLDMIQMQQRLQTELNGMIIGLGKMGDDLHEIDLRMAERQKMIDFITHEIHDVSDLVDGNGEWNPRVKAILKEHGKEHLSADDAYVFISGTLMQRLYDEQQVDQGSRDDLADTIEQEYSDIQNKLKEGRALGLDMSEEEQAVAVVMDNMSDSVERAVNVIAEQEVKREASLETNDGWDFLFDETPSL
ncbi:MAG: hypothetical protein COA69_08620 [Robiginitomaculum sp.]|nr:MAG: hypothetical protein COA69_08620 [Robiginitomaculum sp.]